MLRNPYSLASNGAPSTAVPDFYLVDGKRVSPCIDRLDRTENGGSQACTSRPLVGARRCGSTASSALRSIYPVTQMRFLSATDLGTL
jgi:hypothetical protein